MNSNNFITETNTFQKISHKSNYKSIKNKNLNRIKNLHPLFIMAQSDSPIMKVGFRNNNEIEDWSDFNAAEDEFESIETISTEFEEQKDVEQNNTKKNSKNIEI